MHAYIIIGAGQTERAAYITKQTDRIQVSPWDTITLAPTEDAPYGVEAVHTFLSQLSLTPKYGKDKIGIIRSADMLTTEGQNALLKTLEEPPPHTQIFLETHNPAAVLPTILSRCTQVTVSGEHPNVTLDPSVLQELLTATPGNQIRITGAYTDTSEHALAFITETIYSVGKLLLETHDPSYAFLLHELFSAKSRLAVHVNPKLVIDHIFFQYYLDKPRGIV